MNDLSRKVLGRTGLKVTALGYGAMELRGVPFGGPEITDDQAKLTTERGAGRGHQLHRHLH